ncbi:hypothetical protein [Capybara microvirus Cap1_SP_178]|nr:hypothetical protein [Capybara microvirus Cap1_SP_178]
MSVFKKVVKSVKKRIEHLKRNPLHYHKKLLRSLSNPHLKKNLGKILTGQSRHASPAFSASSVASSGPVYNGKSISEMM